MRVLVAKGNTELQEIVFRYIIGLRTCVYMYEYCRNNRRHYLWNRQNFRQRYHNLQ